MGPVLEQLPSRSLALVQSLVPKEKTLKLPSVHLSEGEGQNAYFAAGVV
jgi:hypothetical protein